VLDEEEEGELDEVPRHFVAHLQEQVVLKISNT
jgi:hypothetical protein